MTAEELQSIALRLANHGWTRYWIDFRRLSDPRSWLMAVQVYRFRPDPFTGIPVLAPIRLSELEDVGFHLIDHASFPYLYTIERTNDDGTPYGSIPDAR